MSLDAQLQTLPKGKLICSRNGTRYKWYQSDGHTSIYLPKKERKLAEQLALKQYLSLMREDLQQEKTALDSYLKHHNANMGKAEYLLTHTPEYKNLLSPYFQPQSQELLEWMNTPYDHNPNYSEQLTHKTMSGHFVRSKSEVLIDMALYMNKIPFRYECALNLGATTIYPDFTIRHPETGEIYYWEHFGMMEIPSYYRNAFSKLQHYTSHGIVPSIQLITTYETKDHPLNSETVDKIIKEYFC